MPRSGWHDDGISLFCREMFFSLDEKSSSAFFYAKELIDERMHLISDLFSWKERHEHDLEMLAGINDIPVILVLDRFLLDVDVKWLHDACLFDSIFLNHSIDVPFITKNGLFLL